MRKMLILIQLHLAAYTVGFVLARWVCTLHGVL